MSRFPKLPLIFSLFLISQENIKFSMVVFNKIHLLTQEKAHNIKYYELVYINKKLAITI